MLLSKTVKIKWRGITKKYYQSKGYEFTKIDDVFEIQIDDLSIGAHIDVDVECDKCGEILIVKWQNYQRCKRDNDVYYCKKCSTELFGKETIRKTLLLKHGKSFYDWCYESLSKEKADEIIGRWDYELNGCSPKDICYSTQRKQYFKCNRGLHSSELKNVGSFTTRKGNELDCDYCNSFAQWGIDNICTDFLEKYWDYEKNNELGIDPWKIDKCSNKKAYIFCQEKKYHGSYNAQLIHFVNGHRCSYCSTFRGMVHRLDSLGKLLEDKGLLYVWSTKNAKSPYEYTIGSHQSAWFECKDKKHEGYYRNIQNSVQCDFRCPSCKSSKGEDKINEFFTTNNINFKTQYRIEDCKDKRSLPFDFAIFDNANNLLFLIEYDGLQHYKPVNFSGSLDMMINNFNNTQKRDKIKDDYCKENKIKLIRIPYTEYENIDKILELQIKNIK